MTSTMPVEQPEGGDLRPGLFAGLAILVISLAHVPDTVSALNYFDPVKRLGWAGLFVAALAYSERTRGALSPTVSLVWLSLLVWMVTRTLLRPYPWAELEVLAGWLMPLAAFAAGSRLAGPKAIRILSVCLLVAGFLQAILMALQYAGIDPLFSFVTNKMDYRPGRMIGTIGYHNQAADFLALCVPAVFWVYKRPVPRLMILLMIFAVVVLAGSRGAIAGYALALIASGALLLPANISIRRKVFLLLLPVIALILLAPVTRSRLLETIDQGLDNPAIASRLMLNKVALQMWAERPLTGWGAGEYALQYTDRLGAILPEEKTHQILRNLVHARESHFDLIQFGAEFGLIGVGLTLLSLFLIIVRLRTFGRDDPRRLSGVFVLLYMLVASSFSFSWQAAMAGPLAGLWLGLISPRESAVAGPEVPGRGWLRVIVLLVALLLLAWHAMWAGLNIRVPAAIERGSDRVLVPPLGHRFLALHGAARAADGNYEDAEPLLRQASKGYIDVILLNNHAHTLGALGRWDEAIEQYARWARSGLNHRMALDNLSAAHETKGDFAAAAETLATRMVLWPDRDPLLIGRLAGLYHRAGQLERVDWVILELRPRTGLPLSEVLPETLNLMGASLMQRGRFEEAERWIRRALEQRPDLISARKNLEVIEKVGGP